MTLKLLHRFKTSIIVFSFITVHLTSFAEPFLKNTEIPLKDSSSYKEPTKRFLEMYSFNEIYAGLKAKGIYLTQKNFYDLVMNQEERGFIGYHASGHKFRVFQDIVKMTLEEVVGLEIKKNFHFFRFPGDPSINDHASASDFLFRYSNSKPVNDNEAEQRNQLISTNFTLYNNFWERFECSVVFFELARSFKPPNFEETIELFFKEMGMSPSHIDKLFEIGQQIENDEAGTLFQIFDFSHQDPVNKNAYEFVDTHIYPCKKKGESVPTHHIISDLYQGDHSSQFLDQYRIVINHETFLNPYSSISMRRYDLNDPHKVQEYEKKLRAAIQKIPVDKRKVENYKLKLKQYWQIDKF